MQTMISLFATVPHRVAGLRRRTAGLLAATTFAIGVAGAAAGPLRCMIETERTADVGAPVIGIVEAVLVQRGDVVQRGQIIARLASSVEQRSVELAMAR